MRPGPLLAALVLLVVAAGPLRGQGAGGLLARHTFPAAGDVLHLHVAGLRPGESVLVHLDRPAEAPPSLVEALVASLDQPFSLSADGVATWVGRADAFGVWSLTVPLDHVDDAHRMIGMRVEDATDPGGAELRLLVQPPTLLVPSEAGLVRIDLRDGRVLAPSLPAEGGLVDAAFSADGLMGFVLRDDGRLEQWPASRWGSRPLAVTRFDASSSDLARERDTGPQFVLMSPSGEPFAPAGRLVFLGDAIAPLDLSPMGQRVTGRRWAVTPDGQTAFVAEDDLIVREIDLVTGLDRRPMSVGAPGDHAVADVAVHGGLLWVATRRFDGRGTLTVFDLATGRLSTSVLAVDPAHFVLLDDDSVLVTPRSGTVFERIVRGIPQEVVRLDVAVLDVAAIPGGALLLTERDGVHRVLQWNALEGVRVLVDQAPAGWRLVTGGHDLAILFGTDGRIHRVVTGPASDGAAHVVEGVVLPPDAPFAVIP